MSDGANGADFRFAGTPAYPAETYTGIATAPRFWSSHKLALRGSCTSEAIPVISANASYGQFSETWRQKSSLHTGKKSIKHRRESLQIEPFARPGYRLGQNWPHSQL
jgi:hypothetical protein